MPRLADFNIDAVGRDKLRRIFMEYGTMNASCSPLPVLDQRIEIRCLYQYGRSESPENSLGAAGRRVDCEPSVERIDEVKNHWVKPSPK